MIVRSPSDNDKIVEDNIDNTRIILYSEGECLKHRIVVQCSICEKVVETSVEKFVIMNQKCDCQVKLHLRELFIKNSEVFFEQCKQIHNDRYIYYNDYKGNKQKIKIQCKLCNGVFFQRAQSHFSDKHGCPFCAVSKLSLEFSLFLSNSGIKYETEVMFNWCVSSSSRPRMLPFDFYLPEYNCLIELHGKQHYEIVPKMTPNADALSKRQDTDRRKAYLARVNRYNYLEIPYNRVNQQTLILEGIRSKDIPYDLIWSRTSVYGCYPVYKRVVGFNNIDLVCI